MIKNSVHMLPNTVNFPLGFWIHLLSSVQGNLWKGYERGEFCHILLTQYECSQWHQSEFPPVEGDQCKNLQQPNNTFVLHIGAKVDDEMVRITLDENWLSSHPPTQLGLKSKYYPNEELCVCAIKHSMLVTIVMPYLVAGALLSVKQPWELTWWVYQCCHHESLPTNSECNSAMCTWVHFSENVIHPVNMAKYNL